MAAGGPRAGGSALEREKSWYGLVVLAVIGVDWVGLTGEAADPSGACASRASPVFSLNTTFPRQQSLDYESWLVAPVHRRRNPQMTAGVLLTSAVMITKETSRPEAQLTDGRCLHLRHMGSNHSLGQVCVGRCLSSAMLTDGLTSKGECCFAFH